MTAYLEARNLTKSYDDHKVVDSVSFGIAQGQVLVLLGKSGSGKTTTMRMLNRLVEPTSGEVFINGEPIMSQDPVRLRRKIGYVIQHNGLFPHLSVRENVATVPRLLKWPAEQTRQRVAALLDALELPPDTFADRLPHELSGGQQQRVSLARAMVAQPDLILMDEPFGALDPVIRVQSRSKFRELAKAQGQTAVIVTHDMEEALELGDWICLLDQGRILQQGTPETVVFEPANPFVEAFLGGNRFQLELKVTRLGQVAEWLGGHWSADPNADLLGLLQPDAGLSQAAQQALLGAFAQYKAHRQAGLSPTAHPAEPPA